MTVEDVKELAQRDPLVFASLYVGRKTFLIGFDDDVIKEFEKEEYSPVIEKGIKLMNEKAEEEFKN